MSGEIERLLEACRVNLRLPSGKKHSALDLIQVIIPVEQCHVGLATGKYPPAEPGDLEMGPLEAAVGVADVIRHEVTLFDPALLLQRQLAKHLPEVLPQFSVETFLRDLGMNTT